MNYYSYRLMISENPKNHILKGKQLFRQYMANMYAKIDTERLPLIWLNQTKLRSEEYKHLRDIVANYGNMNPNTLGKLVILPDTFTRSPWHMHEIHTKCNDIRRSIYRPELFIAFTCIGNLSNFLVKMFFLKHFKNIINSLDIQFLLEAKQYNFNCSRANKGNLTSKV